jgi:acyl CoA:acetate/3-ketoacid CoA transferase beta subunit
MSSNEMSPNESSYTKDEMMAVAASRELRDDALCFVGIGLPSEAANLACATHAPNCVLVYESGPIGPSLMFCHTQSGMACSPRTPTPSCRYPKSSATGCRPAA